MTTSRSRSSKALILLFGLLILVVPFNNLVRYLSFVVMVDPVSSNKIDFYVHYRNVSKPKPSMPHGETSAGTASEVTTCKGYVNSTQGAALERVKVPSKSALIWHMGKAGGGNAKSHLENIWNVSFQSCHPSPCASKTYKLLKRSNRTAVILLLRDPVDRFVSAFYWRQIIFCDPEGDSRSTVHGPHSVLAWEESKNYCLRIGKTDAEEKNVVFGNRYKRDADVLARALCSNNSAVAEQANADMKVIRHSMHSIFDWLGMEWSKYADSIYPVVLEHGIDFTKQVDDAVHWVHRISVFESEERFAERLSFVQNERDCYGMGMSGNSNSNNRRTNSQHSSSSVKESLSENGTICVARYYSADYDILPQLRESLCKTQSCRNAIKSILDRRRIQLKR